MKSTKDYSGIFIVVMVVTILALSVWWEHYKYGECKKVGHSTFYCLVSK